MGNIGSSTPSYFNTPQTGAQYRVTPQNYRQILGNQADIVLKPEQMKDMFEKGYLDVQRQFTEQESNEGIFTIAAKAMAAFIGPSKSIGAITIDPKFLEMIKDPNAEIGFGYTRLRQETLTPLPYPQETRPPSQPTLQNTNINVAPLPPPENQPTQRTQEHAEQLVEFRREQEQRVETPGTPGTYMVERNSGQNNALAGWNSKYNPTGQIATRLSSEYGGLIKKYEAAGIPSNWNAELVQDATWEGAYVEAITQDRDASLRFQYVTRGSADINTATNSNLPASDRAAARSRTEQMVRYINQEGAKADPPYSMTMAQAIADPSKFKDNMAKALGFSGGFSDVQAISTQAQDFRAIGYMSGENPKVATHQVGQMSTGTANGILNRQITGQSTKADGTENFYDTISMLSSRKVNQPGFDVFKPTGASADTTLLDVYKTQTQNTLIPDNAIGDYQKLYNETFKTDLSIDQIKAAKPTLQDMYALRANNFYASAPPKIKNKEGKLVDGPPRTPLPVTANNGRVSLNNPGQDTNRMLNVRLVLEANNGSDQVHRFGSQEITAVNSRATVNFANITLNLSDNLGQNTTDSNAATINRVQITAEDSEAVDTVKLELGQRGVLTGPAGETLATFRPDPANPSGPKVLKDGNGVAVPPERQASFLAEIAQKVTVAETGPAKGRYVAQDKFSGLEGGVGYGYVGGSTGTSTTAPPIQTTPVQVKASEMLELAKGGLKPDDPRIAKIAESIGLPPNTSQQDLFKGVLTNVFGQTEAQANDALTKATGTPPQFGFPTPEQSGTPQNGVQITKPVETKVTQETVTEPGQPVMDRAKVEASLVSNLNTLGQLTQVKPLITDKAQIDALRAAIDNAIKELGDNATINLNGTPTPVATIKADLDNKFKTVDQNFQEGQTALRAEGLRRTSETGEAVSAQTVAGGLQTVSPQDAMIGAPTIPAVADPKAAGSAAYQQSVQDSVKAFSGRLKEMVSDGDISTQEKNSIESWIKSSQQNLANSLGVDAATLGGSNLIQTLRDKKFSETEISTISQTVEMMKDIKAYSNLMPESRSFHKVLDNVHNLQQKLKEFETVGVLRAAFAGEMKELATNNPDRFKAVIQGAYSIPDTAAGKNVIEKMTTMAREGNLPIPPNISFVDPAVLPGANAAYAAKGPGNEPIILLSRDLLDKPGALRDAFAAEMFHHAESATRDLHQDDLAADGSFDSIGDEGQAGLKALRSAQNMESTEAIAKAATDGRNTKATAEGINKPDNRPAGTELAGYDHGTVTLPELGTFKVEFQSAAAAPGAAVQGNPAAQPREIGGLATPGINPHATSRRYTEVKHVDNLPPTNDPIELRRREHISTLDEQMRTFESTPQKNEDGTPMTEPQKNQKFQKLQKDRNDMVGMNAVQYAQTYNIQPPAGSTHQMEQPPEDFLGKAKEMGGQAINGILQFLSTGAPGALCDQIAAQIEGVWKSFYSSVTQNSSAADRSIAEDVVQSGFDVGRDANYEASRTNLINPQGKGAVGQSIQNYRNANPGLRQDKGMLGEFADQDERHRKAFNGVFNR